MVTLQDNKVGSTVAYEPYFYNVKELNGKLNISVPYYYQAHMETKVSTILALDNIDLQTVFITDEHYPMNAKNSPALIHYLWENVPFDFIVNGGDVLVQESTKADAIKAITKFNMLYDFAGDNYFPIVGNHEHNNANGQSTSTQLSLAQVQLAVFSKVRNVIYSGYTAYYFDDAISKCRYYFVGTKQNSQLYTEDIVFDS